MSCMMGLRGCSPPYYPDPFEAYGFPPWTSMIPPSHPPMYGNMMAASQFEQIVREEAAIDSEIEETQKQRDELDKKLEDLKEKKTRLHQWLSIIKSGMWGYGGS